jgi:polygalacturonase
MQAKATKSANLKARPRDRTSGLKSREPINRNSRWVAGKASTAGTLAGHQRALASVQGRITNVNQATPSSPTDLISPSDRSGLVNTIGDASRIGYDL